MCFIKLQYGLQSTVKQCTLKTDEIAAETLCIVTFWIIWLLCNSNHGKNVKCSSCNSAMGKVFTENHLHSAITVFQLANQPCTVTNIYHHDVAEIKKKKQLKVVKIIPIYFSDESTCNLILSVKTKSRSWCVEVLMETFDFHSCNCKCHTYELVVRGWKTELLRF